MRWPQPGCGRAGSPLQLAGKAAVDMAREEGGALGAKVVAHCHSMRRWQTVGRLKTGLPELGGVGVRVLCGNALVCCAEKNKTWRLSCAGSVSDAISHLPLLFYPDGV